MFTSTLLFHTLKPDRCLAEMAEWEAHQVGDTQGLMVLAKLL